MNELILIIISTLLISAFALVGIVTLFIKEKLLHRVLLLLVALSAGALMGGAFFHLLPEAIELGGPGVISYALGGFILFFLIEKIFHWRHCHKEKCNIHTFGYMNLVGDSIHNFIDGLIIAVAFLNGTELGFATVIAIALHEIPQEVGDFGVLIYSGMEKYRALVLNFMVALTVVLGGIVGFYLSGTIEPFTKILMPIAAGGFLYIAASDLIPEIRNIQDLKKSIFTFLMFLLGIALMLLIKG